MESHGILDEGCDDLMRSIAKQLAPYLQHSFENDFLYVVSTALAKGRALAIMSAYKSALGVNN